MSDTDFRLFAQKIELMNETLKEHGEILKHLARASTTQAVQSEQLRSITVKVDAMFGHVDRIKAHQAQCPKSQIARLWWAVGIMFTGMVTLVATSFHK